MLDKQAEVEIRAATVQAVERLRVAAASAGLEAVTSVELDWRLWQMSEEVVLAGKTPAHATPGGSGSSPSAETGAGEGTGAATGAGAGGSAGAGASSGAATPVDGGVQSSTVAVDESGLPPFHRTLTVYY